MSQQGGFNGDGAGTAKRVYQGRGPVPSGGQEQSGSQGLSQRGFSPSQAVSSSMEQ